MSVSEDSRTIFYCWQSDIENKLNRGFIQDALERAIEPLSSLDLELYVLDRDTKDEPGSPDIAQVIADKIKSAAIFVADVSIVNSGTPGRLTPNPNVMFELGLAVNALGWENILLVFNLSTGNIEELPFDIRGHRPIPYCLPNDKLEKPDVRKYLVGMLHSRLLECIKRQIATTPKVKIVFDSEFTAMRFGVRNDGQVAITVEKFTLEYPTAIGINNFPFDHRPIVQATEGSYEDRTPTFKLTLIRTDAPIAHGFPDIWRLPPKIEPGETEMFKVMVFGFKSDAPKDSVLKMQLSLTDGNPIKLQITLGELFNPPESLPLVKKS